MVMDLFPISIGTLVAIMVGFSYYWWRMDYMVQMQKLADKHELSRQTQIDQRERDRQAQLDQRERNRQDHEYEILQLLIDACPNCRGQYHAHSTIT